MSLTVKIRGDATQFEKTMRGVNSTISGLGTKVAALGGAALAAAGSYEVLAASIGFLKSASDEASGIESLKMQFKTLLGSADAAEKRMKELVDFAATTPFEIKELAATSKLLQTLGGSLLATGEGLRMVGDAAAISGQPLSEVGLHIGRVFNAITSGTSAGESIARLQELGLMSGEVKIRFEQLADAQKKGESRTYKQEEALRLLQKVFKSTSGAMAELANTTEGKTSNMVDNINQLKVAFGTGMNDGIKSALDATNTMLPQFQEKFSEAGLQIGAAITEAVNGDLQRFADIGQLVGEVISQALKATIIAGLDQLGEEIGQFLSFGAKSYTDTSSTANQATMGLAGMIADATKSQTNIKTEMDRVSPAIQDSIRMFQLKNEASQYYGFSENMSEELKRAIRDGMIEAERYYSRGAKFSN